MHQRNWLCAFAAIPFLTLGLYGQTADDAAAPDDQAAQAETVRTAAHASRWDYPKTTSLETGQQIHVVAKGDTLWDLGTKYLGNPFAWPQIWELNKWVKDPHWIYPGDPIVVEASRSTVAQSKDQNLSSDEVADLQPDLKLRPKRVQDEYAYSFQDFIQLPYLVPSSAEVYFKQAGAVRVVGHEDSTRNMMAEGDFLYVNGGSDQGFKAGDRLVITTVAARKFYHPDDKRHQKVLGDVVEQCGIIRVTRVYPRQSVAIVEHSLDGITKGGYALPFVEPVAIINHLRSDTASPVQIKDPTSKIIYIWHNEAVAAGGDMVIMDHGTQEGFNVGDILLSARTMPLADGKTKPAPDTTNYYLGQVIVVKAGEHSATCRVLRSRSEVLVGDLLTR